MFHLHLTWEHHHQVYNMLPSKSSDNVHVVRSTGSLGNDHYDGQHSRGLEDEYASFKMKTSNDLKPSFHRDT